MSEQTMTPEAAMLLLDAFTMECPTVTGKASLKAIRAAVAELAQERDEFRKDRDEWKEYCARVSEGKEAAETERDALRRRVEEQQAKIDALMLEYCPDEMTPAQLEEWGRHQRPGRDASAKAKLESAKP